MSHRTSVSQAREALVSHLKIHAKKAKRTSKSNSPLATYQDNIAIRLGYLNWSLLHRDLGRMSDDRFGALCSEAALKFDWNDTSLPSPLSEEAAVEEMKAWVKQHFTPLIDFAFYDSESETGFSWPDVDLSDELQNEFSDRYELSLIEKVAIELELNFGLWGKEYDPREDEGSLM